MQMLDRIQRRLIIVCITVLLTVTSVLSVVSYLYFGESLDTQIRQELDNLADSVVASIDSIDIVGKQNTGIPDAIIAAVPIEGTESPKTIRLEWFTADGKLVAQRGRYPISLSFVPENQIVEQAQPHAFVLTRAALYQHRVIGYLRIARPLESRDLMLRKLMLGLIVGVGCALVLSTIGIMVLLRHSMQPATEMFRKLKQFTADASHELRNPIMAVKTNAEAALKYSNALAESDRQKLQAITKAADQMQTLTDALIELSRLDSDHTIMDGEVQNISEICTALTEHYRVSSAKQILTEVDAEPELLVRASNLDIQQLLGNVIANAFQYTPEGGAVRIKACKQGQSVVVEVSDTGIGIERDSLEKIFDRFWRADKARTQRNSGSGLGLSIASAVAAKYRGSLEARSESGAGSTFVIRLPAQQSS